MPLKRHRGSPDETRERLLVAGADEINRVGYLATDSNKLARAAGYAPAMFYRHFPDKRSFFLAIYDRWVGAEWESIGTLIRQGGPHLARNLVDHILALHKQWRGLRRSLRILIASDPIVREAYQHQRARQLDLLSPMPRTRAATLLWTIERIADAYADDDLTALDLDEREVRAHLEQQIGTVFRS
jgi:AcrR family transcriptional regulator